MQKEDLKILIVDDDPTFGKALKEALTRAGYGVIHCVKPDDALASVKLQVVHAAVIDCMLPKMNGRDLTLKLKEEVSKDLPVILMSGIYKDKTYSKDALQSTGASTFMTKPFDVQDLLQNLDRKLAHLIDVPLVPIHDIMSRSQLTAKERIKAINDSDPVHGLDLPWLYSLLMDPAINGHLNIITADGEVAGVGFSRGNIVQVNLKDTQSYFGVLLVEKGFVSSAELEEIMANSGKSKRMGERLVECNVLSPHAINIVIAEQQGIRLAKTVDNTSVKVNFIESEGIREDAHIDRQLFSELLNDWVNSKLPMEWLKAFYVPWMHHTVRKGADFNPAHKALQLPLVANLDKFLDNVISGKTLDQVFLGGGYREDEAIRAFHILLLSRVICFGAQKKTSDHTAQKARLERLDAELEKQTYFARLGVSPKAKESEIKRNYHELAKVLHPDKLTPETPQELRDLTRSAFAKISQAYEILSNSNSKADYLRELEQGRAELILEAESMIEQGKVFLGKGDIKKARVLFENAAELAPPSSELRLLLMWARLKSGPPPGDSRFAADVKEQLAQIPPEDRHNSTYYFVKGLLQRYTEDIEGARKSFEHAVSIDPDFFDARREVNVLRLQAKNTKSTDLLRGDLKDVVGKLFKRK